MTEPADIVRTISRTLFSVRFLHTGYGLPRPEIISEYIWLEPDEDTKNVFKNYSIGYRFFNDLLVVFMRCSNLVPTTPFLKITEEVRLRFYLQVSADFLNKTQVQAVGAAQLYQFSNKVNIATGGFISKHTEGVNDDDLIAVDLAAPGKTCFGVLDVFNTGAVNSTYDLFSGVQQTFNSPGYSIRFISQI